MQEKQDHLVDRTPDETMRQNPRESIIPNTPEREEKFDDKKAVTVLEGEKGTEVRGPGTMDDEGDPAQEDTQATEYYFDK